MTTTLVLKLGGELLESAAQREQIAACCAAIAARRPLVVVHGGGRAVDVELARRGIAPKKIDGLRVTDGPTLEAVVAVLAGSSNTDLVAALVGTGVAAVGLTGVDAGFGRAVRSSAHRTSAGEEADLGLVGDPVRPDPSLVGLLIERRYVPVIASLGIDGNAILNVNADVMACRLAAALEADLVIAGATPGVFDAAGRPIAQLDVDGIENAIADGTATAGMIAKLSACRAALLDGVAEIRIVDGRTLAADRGPDAVPGTTLVSAAIAGQDIR